MFILPYLSTRERRRPWGALALVRFSEGEKRKIVSTDKRKLSKIDATK